MCTRIDNDFPYLQQIPFMSGEIIHFNATEKGEIPSSVRDGAGLNRGNPEEINTGMFPKLLTREQNGNRPISLRKSLGKLNSIMDR